MFKWVPVLLATACCVGLVPQAYAAKPKPSAREPIQLSTGCVSPNNSSDRPKSAQATKHLGQRFHCKKLHQTAHSHSCERYQRLGFDRAFLVNNAG